MVDTEAINDVEEQSPVITLPDDPVLRARLELKLEEYRGRIDPYRAPELQQDNHYRVDVLETLLLHGAVNTYNLSLKCADWIGKAYFDAEAFNSSCAVINDYVTTGGANASGGTGLPELPNANEATES